MAVQGRRKSSAKTVRVKSCRVKRACACERASAFGLNRREAEGSARLIRKENDTARSEARDLQNRMRPRNHRPGGARTEHSRVALQAVARKVVHPRDHGAP